MPWSGLWIAGIGEFGGAGLYGVGLAVRLVGSTVGRRRVELQTGSVATVRDTVDALPTTQQQDKAGAKAGVSCANENCERTQDHESQASAWLSQGQRVLGSHRLKTEHIITNAGVGVAARSCDHPPGGFLDREPMEPAFHPITYSRLPSWHGAAYPKWKGAAWERGGWPGSFRDRSCLH